MPEPQANTPVYELPNHQRHAKLDKQKNTKRDDKRRIDSKQGDIHKKHQYYTFADAVDLCVILPISVQRRVQNTLKSRHSPRV